MPRLNQNTIKDLQGLSKGERSFLAELYNLFEKGCYEILHDIKETCNNPDMTEEQKVKHLRLCFHKLKGLAVNIGAQSMYEECNDLQKNVDLTTFDLSNLRSSIVDCNQLLKQELSV